MKVTDHLKNAKGKTLFSFELIPPVKGRNIQDLYNNIDPLMEFDPPFIDVTTSREEYVYIDKEGLLDKKVTRMRPGTVAISWHYGHWNSYGANAQIEIDGKRVTADVRRAMGLCPNPVMERDESIGKVGLTDPIGGSAAFFNTRVKLVKV